MHLRRSEIIALLITTLAFLVGIYFYPQLPEKMATHWNSTGQVDGFMNRFWGTFLMPIIFFALFLIFLVVPNIDPKRANIDKFRRYFDGFIVILFLFLFYLYLIAIFWNLNYRFNLVSFIVPAIAVLLYAAGILISKAEPNWTIGIRTPWTLSNENVWRKTHILGAKLFKITAVISLIGIFATNYAFWIFIIPTILSAFYSILYSYLEYRKENKR